MLHDELIEHNGETIRLIIMSMKTARKFGIGHSDIYKLDGMKTVILLAVAMFDDNVLDRLERQLLPVGGQSCLDDGPRIHAVPSHGIFFGRSTGGGQFGRSWRNYMKRRR